MRKILLSKLGLGLCGFYLAIAIPLLVAHSFSRDVKAAHVFGALATLPAGLLTTWLGLQELIMQHPWLNNWWMFASMSAVMCYAIGWVLGTIASLPRRGE